MAEVAVQSEQGPVLTKDIVPKKEGNTEVLNTPFIFQSMMIRPLCRNYEGNK